MLSKLFKTPEALAVLTLAILSLAAVGGSVILADGDDDDDRYVVRGKSLLVFDGDDTPYMGVQLEEEVDLDEGGARVTEVVEDSPAHEAGLREGDVIVEFDERTIRGPAALTKMLHKRQPGDEVEVSVVRDGRRQTITIELGSRSQVWSGVLPRGSIAWSTGDGQGYSFVQPKILELTEGLERLEKLEPIEIPGFSVVAPNFNFRFGSRAMLGVQLVETTPELREHLGGTDDAGVIVSKVLAGTPADQAGIQVGDLILSVNGDDVKNSRELRNGLHDKAGETFDIEVVRDGQRRQLQVTIPEPDDDSPTGPRALRYSYPDAGEAVRIAVREARVARQINVEQVRDAVRVAVRAARTAQRLQGAEIRRAVREATRATREVRRQVDRATRDAVRRARAEHRALL